MKEYHTEITIKDSIENVWNVLTDFEAYPEWNPLVEWLKGDFVTGGNIQVFIKPLNRAFKATLQKVEKNTEFTWIGVQIAPWIISGEHYYRLEKIDQDSTRLLHGEIFRGLISPLIGSSVLGKMEKTFHQHNQLLKRRIENE